MPAANSTAKQELLGDFDPWKLLETPLIYGALKTLLEINPFPGCQFDSSLALAALAQLNGEHAEALRAINHALKIEPRNPTAHLQHGALHPFFAERIGCAWADAAVATLDGAPRRV